MIWRSRKKFWGRHNELLVITISVVGAFGLFVLCALLSAYP